MLLLCCFTERNRKVSFASSLSVYVKMNSNVIIFIISALALFPLLIECYAEKCPTSKRTEKKLLLYSEDFQRGASRLK